MAGLFSLNICLIMFNISLFNVIDIYNNYYDNHSNHLLDNLYIQTYIWTHILTLGILTFYLIKAHSKNGMDILFNKKNITFLVFKKDYYISLKRSYYNTIGMMGKETSQLEKTQLEKIFKNADKSKKSKYKI